MERNPGISLFERRAGVAAAVGEVLFVAVLEVTKDESRILTAPELMEEVEEDVEVEVVLPAAVDDVGCFFVTI